MLRSERKETAIKFRCNISPPIVTGVNTTSPQKFFVEDIASLFDIDSITYCIHIFILVRSLYEWKFT